MSLCKNGHGVTDGQKFCGECGTATGPELSDETLPARADPAAPESAEAVGRSSEGIRLIRALLDNEFTTYESARRFDIPFEVEVDDLRRVDSLIRGRFEQETPIEPGVGVDFGATVRYADQSSERYLDLESLLDEGGEREDPERLFLHWSQLVRDPLGAEAKVRIEYITDKRLDIEERQVGSFHIANVKLSVTGVDPDWTRITADRVAANIRELEIAGIYKPLQVFRNREVIFMCSFLVASVVASIMARVISRNLANYEVENADRLRSLEQILEEPDLESRFERFATLQYDPLDPSPISETVRVQATYAISFISIFMLGYWLLPKLVPKSFIGIGLTGKRMRRYRAVFNFVVFTALVGGVLFPILRFVFGALF